MAESANPVSVFRSISRSLFFDSSWDLEKQWSQTVDFLNGFFLQLDSVASNNYRNEPTDFSISRTHWKPDLSAVTCHNAACAKPFSLTERRHHCRRCGEIFCNTCTVYQRKLNCLGDADPTGKFHRVCAVCYNEGPQSMGQSRNWSEVFKQVRSTRQVAGTTLNSAAKQQTARGKVSVSNFRDVLNFEAELERLKEGYWKSLTVGNIGRLMEQIGVNIYKDTSWKNSSLVVLGRMSNKCCECQREFGMTRQRHHCVVCGVGVCVECSRKDLIVFIPDDPQSPAEDPPIDAQLSVVRIVGCPEREPLRCEYLRTCSKCITRLEDRQVADYEETKRSRDRTQVEENDESEVFLSRMVAVSDKLRSLRTRIARYLTSYRELVDSIETGSAQLTHGQPKSIIQALAKTQGDLSDLLTEIITVILSLKKIRPASGARMSIVKNVILSSCDFYHENMAAYRSLQRKVEADIPPEVLLAIQQEVDKKAINGCYLTAKQLIYECLILAGRYQLNEAFLEKLAPLALAAESDVKSVVPVTDWPDHEHCVGEFLKTQLRGQHLLIRPSRRLTALRGKTHIAEVIRDRVPILLHQLYLQLNAKCSRKRFQLTKSELTKLLASSDGFIEI